MRRDKKAQAKRRKAKIVKAIRRERCVQCGAKGFEMCKPGCSVPGMYPF